MENMETKETKDINETAGTTPAGKKKLAPAIRKETIRVTAVTAAGVAVLILGFVVGHAALPEKIPFDYTVILGALAGGGVAVLNFFLMALSVQAVASAADDDTARTLMKASYRNRLFLQLGWIAIAIFVPCFQRVAGIAPLLFPSLGIKLMAMIGVYN
ncbi:MAG: ATP synthase subunit I [Lachnospiraceae bacterium]|nr:ATP synthase subunit I [Lachnospiraceae bacterium]